jgi:hypothetical protein
MALAGIATETWLCPLVQYWISQSKSNSYDLINLALLKNCAEFSLSSIHLVCEPKESEIPRRLYSCTGLNSVSLCSNAEQYISKL